MSDLQPARRPRRPQTLDLRHAQPGAAPARTRRPLPAPPVRRPTVTRPEGMPDPRRLEQRLVAPAPQPAAPQAQAQAQAPAQPKPAKPRPAQRSGWRKIGSVLQYPLIAAGALLAAYSTAFGQWIVLIFVIFAIVARKPSSLSFGIALFLLITIPLFQLLGQSGIAENVAVYVFELLVFGVAQALWELRKTRAV